MQSFVFRGWAVREKDNPLCYALTEEGGRRFPEWKPVSHCPMDGMPIYRRWIDAGIATLTECPYCMPKPVETETNIKEGEPPYRSTN